MFSNMLDDQLPDFFVIDGSSCDECMLKGQLAVWYPMQQAAHNPREPVQACFDQASGYVFVVLTKRLGQLTQSETGQDRIDGREELGAPRDRVRKGPVSLGPDRHGLG